MTAKRVFFIVDDDQDDREFFMEAIEKFNPLAACHAAENGEEALNKLRDGSIGRPDFIFLDLNMPLVDGRTCLKQLKSDNSFKDIPVIIFTTSSNPKDEAETRRMGAAYFLTKPVSFQKLCELLEQAIETIETRKSENKLI
jgi:CheY-like chemotaxis protein